MKSRLNQLKSIEQVTYEKLKVTPVDEKALKEQMLKVFGTENINDVPEKQTAFQLLTPALVDLMTHFGSLTNICGDSFFGAKVRREDQTEIWVDISGVNKFKDIRKALVSQLNIPSKSIKEKGIVSFSLVNESAEESSGQKVEAQFVPLKSNNNKNFILPKDNV